MHNRGENPVKYLWRIENAILDLLSAAARSDQDAMSVACNAIFDDVKRARPSAYSRAILGEARDDRS
jgi:hypothetical protein